MTAAEQQEAVRLGDERRSGAGARVATFVE
jgi:hypothetical protein